MALSPQIDAELAAQLYGTPMPSLADTAAPATTVDPWAWVPQEWQTSPEQIGAVAPPIAVPGGAPPIPALPSMAPPIVEPPPPPVPPDAITGAAIPPPAPAPPLPDAVTGVGPGPGVADLHGFSVTTLPPPNADSELLADPLRMQDNGPLAPTPAYSDEQVNQAMDQIGLRGGPQLEQMAVDREVARRAKLAADTARIEADNLRRAQEDLDAHRAAAATAQAKSEQIMAEATDLANRKTDPDRLVRSMSGGQTVAELLALATGALIAGRTGGPNVAMDLLQRRIDRDIDAQKQDVENAKFGLQLRRSAVADEYARHGDLYRAGEVVRLATYQAAYNTMAAEQQNFDPRGYQALERGRVMQQWVARAAAASENLRKTAFDETLKTIKAEQEEREQKRKALETESVIAKNRAEAAKLYSEASKARADKTVLTPEQIHQTFPSFPVAAIPPEGATVADLKKRAELSKESEEYKAAARGNDPHQLDIQRAVPGVTDDRGELVHFADKDMAAKVADAKEAADEMHRLTRELIGMVKRNGWSSNVVKSKAWRKARQNYNEILIRKKEADKLGVLTGPDVGIVTQEIGTDDPTEARGGQVLEALEHFDRNQIEGFNTKIRNKAIVGRGRTLARWEPPALDDKPREETVDDIQLERLMSPPEADEIPPPSHEDMLKVADGTKSARAAFDEAEGASPWQLKKLSDLASLATGAADDPAAVSARETLGKVADAAQTMKIRRLAKQALDEAARYSAESGVALPDRGVAHETAPPEKR